MSSANDGRSASPSALKGSACDSCKARKTKCDRSSPCASCVTAGIPCRFTRRNPEKRQRVLLSSKYNEAVENVNVQLRDISATLQTLACSNQHLLPQPHQRPSSDEPLDTSALYTSYTGASSFHAQTELFTGSLNGPLKDQTDRTPPSMSTSEMRLQEAVPSPLPQPQSLEKADFEPLKNYERQLPLPPMEVVLNLLRLSRTNKQRFFIDTPLFNESEFSDICCSIYFPTESYTTSAWIVVNTGLIFLFQSLKVALYSEVGVSRSDVRNNISQLVSNAMEACQDLKLCMEPSFQACRALGLLATLCLKTGRTAIAWRLMTAAARMSLDLGLHRLPPGEGCREVSAKHLTFWHIYAWEKGLALSLGRMPSIHHDDVTTARPSFAEDLPGVPNQVFTAFISYAIVAGNIHQQLFSAAAQKEPSHVLVVRANHFSDALKQVQYSLDTATDLDDDEDLYPTIKDAAMLLRIIMKSLLTIVNRIKPPNDRLRHPLQCCDESVEAARQALQHITAAGRHLGNNVVGLVFFLNTIFSFVPFTPFVVLVGNVIATSSIPDLEILASVLTLMRPAAESSPTIQKTTHTCDGLYKIALVALEKVGLSADKDVNSFETGVTVPILGSVDQSELAVDVTVPDNALPSMELDLPMLQNDWDSVLGDLDMELNNFDPKSMANLVEPYLNDRLDWQ